MTQLPRSNPLPSVCMKFLEIHALRRLEERGESERPDQTGEEGELNFSSER